MPRTLVTTAAPKQGWGIGLYQAKRIIEARGGTVEVMSEEAAGTTFSVRQPLRLGVRSSA